MEGENSQPLHKQFSSHVKDKEFFKLFITMLVYSLLPKFDELICTICATCKPDMVCLVESWLCDDINDNEIKIPRYQHRLDRNRHGGGVLMYASEQLIEPTTIMWF